MPNPPDILAEARLRQKQLLDQLAMSPVVDVFGVVSPAGVSGGKLRGEELWTLRLIFDAWRIQGAQVQTRPLTIQRKVTDRELTNFRSSITPCKVIHVRARVINNPTTGSNDALLEALVGGDDSDRELSALATELQKPVTYEDPAFGILILDRRINWFIGNADWKGFPVVINVSAQVVADVPRSLQTAKTLWQAQDTWHDRIRDYAVRELLPLKNESWLDEGEAAVSPDQFKERMKLESVTVHSDGSFEFCHHDGNLFSGHAIEISGNLIDGPKTADIPG